MNSGTLIRSAREDAGLTQAALAGRLGTTQSAIARLEGAASNPWVGTLERVFAALARRLDVVTGPADIDVAQVEAQLRLTPAERLRRHHAAARGLARLTRTATRVERVG